MEECKINAGTACFLVKDNSLLEGWESPIYKWLKKEGFDAWDGKGVYSSVDWIYINLSSKVFAPGMPGVKLTSVIANHAITFEEFETIYKIFKKYEGLEVLRMTAAEQKDWNEKKDKAKEEDRLYWQDMTPEKYLSEVKSIFFGRYVTCPTEESLAYFEGESEAIREMYNGKCRPEYAAWMLDFKR